MGYAVLDDRNIRQEFFKRLDQAERGSWAGKVASVFNSDRLTEEYRWLGNIPAMREWIGSRKEQPIRSDVYRLTNKPYESTLAVYREELRRDKTGQLLIRIGEQAAAAVSHWEELLSALIIAGETTDLCYDGQFYFDTDHVSGASGTQTNDLTATEVPAANVGTTTAPTSTELSNIFLQMVQHLYSLKDDVGQPINQNAKSFLVMVPTAFWAAAAQVLTKEFLTQGVSNPARDIGINFEVVQNPRLTWTTKLAMFRMDGAMKPLIMQSEQEMLIQSLQDGSEEDFKNRRFLYGISNWRTVGFGLWQHAALVTLS